MVPPKIMEIQSLFSVILFIISFFAITHTDTVLCVETCKPTSCSPTGPIVHFPFRIGHQPRQCGFPGFDLSCNNQSQLIINLNFAGNFVVTEIDYISQTISIKPELCPPIRIDAFNPLDSPFDIGFLDKYLYFNCTSAAVWFYPSGVEVLNCVPGLNGTVVAVPRRSRDGFIDQISAGSCQYVNLTSDILVGFGWIAPFCQKCEIENGTCGYKNVQTNEIGCSLPSTTGNLNLMSCFLLSISVV